MKFSVRLTQAQVDGLENYLKENSGDIHKQISQMDIENELQSMLNQFLKKGAVSNHIEKFEKEVSLSQTWLKVAPPSEIEYLLGKAVKDGWFVYHPLPKSLVVWMFKNRTKVKYDCV